MNDNPEEPIRCAKCNSTQIHAERRGWSRGLGLLGSEDIIITCLKCGHRSRPPEKSHTAWLLGVAAGVLIIGLACFYSLGLL